MRRNSYDQISSLIIFLTSVLALVSCVGDSGSRVDALARAFDRHESNVPITSEGVVERILPDDRSGASHQRFILRLSSGQTVLIDHNIDLAPRIDDLRAGDIVSFSGEYVWNEQGGLIHWTHHDPEGRHTAGWLKHNGRTYQ